MRLAYIHQYFKKPNMNGGTRSYEFARRLAIRGHVVIIITSDLENTFPGWKIEFVEGIEVHWVSVKYSNNFGFLRRFYSFCKFLVLSSVHILTLKVDKVIATSTPLTVAIPALINRFIKSVPYVFEVRDVWPEVPIAMGVIKNKFLIYLALKLEFIAYKYAESLITLSTDMKSSIESRYRIFDISVIPNAADTELFRVNSVDFSCELVKSLNAIKNRHKRVVFYTGTLGLVNNLASFLKLSSFSEGDIGFVIVGDGREKVELVKMAEDYGVLNKTLYFIPPVQKKQLRFLHYFFDMATSTVLPISALNANSANKVFDAFAAGTPLLINHTGWIADLIIQERCGLVIENDPSVADFQSLKKFLYDFEGLEEAKRNSLSLGKTKFNRDELFKKFCTIIES